MEISGTLILLAIVAFLLVLKLLFPGINIFTLIDPKKQHFYKAYTRDDQLVLSGFRKEKSIPINQIKRLSMGPFPLRVTMDEKGMFAVQIDTETESFYLFQSPFNLFAPALKREVIIQLRNTNPKIELDYNLTKYTEESLADMYINKDQIKRGLIIVLIVFVPVLLMILADYLKIILGK
jgi:hypothetical protein